MIGLLFSPNQIVHAQYCVPFLGEDIDFQVTPRFVDVEADWYNSWIEYTGFNAV